MPTAPPKPKASKPKAASPAKAAHARHPLAAARLALLAVVTVCVGVSLVAAAAATREASLLHAAIDLRISLIATLGALLAGGVLLLRQQRGVRRPVAVLSQAMAEVATSHDYKRGVDLAAEPEMAELVKAYNRMLEAIAERDHRIARQLAARTTEVAQARAAKAEIVAALRQEIAPSISAMQALAEKLASGDAPDSRDAAGIIARAGEGLGALLADLADHSGPDAPAVALSAGTVDVGAAAEEVASLFWGLASAKGLDLAVYVDPATPRSVQGDPVRVRQVIAGLVNAAIDATTAGGVLIEVEPDSVASLRISVRDTRPPGAVAAPAGLGLAVCEKLVRAMGGRMKVSADGGRGAACAFRLPAPLVEPARPWPTASKPGATARVVHEGVATRRALGRYAARAGYAVAAEPDAPADLVLAAAASLALEPAGVPTICLGEQGDARALALLNASAAGAQLALPVRRSELAILIAQHAAGEPLRETWLEAPISKPAAPPMAVSSTPSKTAPAEAIALLADLEKAIENDALSLVYQPQFDREGRQIMGVETLVRWKDPVRGPVSPALFIPLAEEYGRIDRLTDWVMARALAETADLEGLPVAFNASALEFIDAGIVNRISEVLDRTGFDPRRLEVEITETAILENEEQVRQNMKALRGLGLKVALDDFGAGYSSLGHLRRYPFDKLKIDREFVIDCTRDVQSATVVHAVVSIGRALGMKVVAEGVETEQQRQFLKIAGVHSMQGFLFGKPMAIGDLRGVLARANEALSA